MFFSNNTITKWWIDYVAHCVTYEVNKSPKKFQTFYHIVSWSVTWRVGIYYCPLLFQIGQKRGEGEGGESYIIFDVYLYIYIRKNIVYCLVMDDLLDVIKSFN